MPGAVAINGGVGVMEMRRPQVNMDLLPSVDDVMNSVAAVAAEIAENAHITLREEEPVSHEAVDKEPVGKVETSAAESMDEPTKKQPISICIENLHIHMDERMTTNYGPGALEGVSGEDCEADEEACDCGHGKSCDHCTSKSCDQSDDDDDGIDFDQMVRFIRRRTGMCERTVLAFLAAQIEYLDSVIDEEDEV